MRKLLNSGDLRHRVAIQERIEEQDSDTGAVSYEWVMVNDSERGDWSSVPAAILPVSAREFEAAAATQAQTSTRFVIRARDGLIPKMRLVHRGRNYNINGVLRDADSGIEYQTLTCSDGPDNG